MKYLLTFSLFAVLTLFFISVLVSQKDPPTTKKEPWKTHTTRVTLTPTSHPPTITQTAETDTTLPSATQIVATSPSLVPKSNKVLGTSTQPTIPPTPSTIFLSVTTPQDNQTVTSSVISVQGRTIPNAEVFVNDQSLRANNQGLFQTTVTLEEGENLISVSANDIAGNYSEKELVVHFNG